MVFGMRTLSIVVFIYCIIEALVYVSSSPSVSKAVSASFGFVHDAPQLNLNATPADDNFGVKSQEHDSNRFQTVKKHKRQVNSSKLSISSHSDQDDIIVFKPWPRNNDTGNPTIPYEIKSQDEEVTHMIQNAIKEWSKHTCVDFVPKTPSDVNYVLYKYRPDTSMCGVISGMTGKGVQEVPMSESCRTMGYASMYTGLTIGLFPEYLRPDRDEYLTINEDNLELNTHNLDKFTNTEVNTHGIGFDYTSALLPSSKELSVNDGITFATKNPTYQGLIGRFKGKVSHRNKLMVNAYYNCTKPWLAKCGYKHDPCSNEGYIGPDCKCVCNRGTFGTHCDQSFDKDYYGYFLPPCSKDIDHETVLTSPNFPVFILEDTWCVYRIKAPKNHKVKIYFNKFHIAKRYTVCHDSFLEIRYQSKYHGFMACGDSVKGRTFVSNSDEMILYLDVSNNNSKGFEAQVTFLDGSSNKPFISSDGHTIEIPFTCLQMIILAAFSCVFHFYGIWM